MPGYTRFFGEKAIYSLNPTSEEVARHMAKALSSPPVQVWELSQLLPDRSDEPVGDIAGPIEDDDDEGDDPF